MVSRPMILILDLLRSLAGMAAVGTVGGGLGGLLLGDVVRASATYHIAFQTGIGCVLAAGTIFAILGARGHVVFGDLVGDFRTESASMPSLPGDRFAEIAVEFVGGAMWGVICGMLMGLLAGTVGPFLGAAHGPTLAGTVSGATLGFVLALLAALFRSIRHRSTTARKPIPFSEYFRAGNSVEPKAEEAILLDPGSRKPDVPGGEP